MATEQYEIRFLNKHDALSINAPSSPIDNSLRRMRSARRLQSSFKIGAAFCVVIAVFFWMLGVLHFLRIATEFTLPWASEVIGTMEMILVTFLVVGTIVACIALIRAILVESHNNGDLGGNGNNASAAAAIPAASL